MCSDLVFSVYVRRRSGLLEIFDPPELTISAAISRDWEKVGPILRPRPAEFLPTYPLPWGNIPERPWWASSWTPAELLRPTDG